jgi:hypothetical protein
LPVVSTKCAHLCLSCWASDVATPVM